MVKIEGTSYLTSFVFAFGGTGSSESKAATIYIVLDVKGTEDYFNHAWGMQRNAYPFFGTIVHGHANHLSDDWSSTAYWYQTLSTEDEITILQRNSVRSLNR